MKKLKVLLLLVLVLFTTGCGKRVPTTEEKFKDAFKDYKVEDVTSDFNFVNKAFKVTGSNDLVVIFFDCKSVDVTQDIYYDEITNITKKAAAELIADNGKEYEYNENDIEKTITKGDNYTIAQYSLKDTYYRVSWIDNTYIYGKIDIGSKTTLVNLMNSLKYSMSNMCIYYDYYEVYDMEEKNVGVSLTKILEEGELLAMNIHRGVQVAKNRNTLDAVNRIVKKVNSFYTKIENIKLSNNNLKQALNIFRTIKDGLSELKLVKDSIINQNANVKVNPSM